MMEIIHDVPEDILAVAARGKMTKRDYVQTLIPAMERHVNEFKSIKLLFCVGILDNVELGAMWEDTKFGVTHWNDFSHIALVTDVGWLENTARFFKPFFPGEIKIFDQSDYEVALEWLLTRKKEGDRDI